VVTSPRIVITLHSGLTLTLSQRETEKNDQTRQNYQLKLAGQL